MNKYLIKIIDQLQILSIISAALLEIPILNKIILTTNLLISIYLIFIKKYINKSILVYLISVIFMFTFLILIGLLKGNQLNDIFHFILPLFSLFNILVYYVLSQKYSIDRYLFIYYVCSIFVALKIISLFLLFYNQLFLEFVPLYDPDISKSSWVAYQRGLIRVYVDQALLIPIGILISFYLFKKTNIIILIALFFSLLLTQTTAFIFCYILVIFLTILIYYKKFEKIFISTFAISSLALFSILYFDLILEIFNEKSLYSIPIKLDQLDIAFNSIANNPFFGGGMGYIFSNGAHTIEVVFLHILATTGLIGFLFYFYMLFYWIIASLRYFFADRMILTLTLGYSTIVIESFSNPYLIGASTGLFLIPLIATRVIQISDNMKNSHNIQS